MNFPSVRIEGAILSADLLARLESGDLNSQRPVDFGAASPSTLKDDIVRAWTHAQAYHRAFRDKLEALKPGATGTTETRNLFVIPLLALLGYNDLEFSRPELVGDKSFPISHRLPSRDGFAVHIIGARESLDKPSVSGSGTRIRPHALVQEYLNLTEHLYALVTNGRLLRLLRDSTRLIKLSYVEFDLDRIFAEELFADFAVLYRLLHVSRLPQSRAIAAQSLLECYHQDALDSGARIRDGLSIAVEQALQELGSGFLARTPALQSSVADGSLTARDFYHAILRLIYRLLFLMVAEERGLLFPANTEARRRRIYQDFYSIHRLRRLAERPALVEPGKGDLWQGLLSTFRLFEVEGAGTPLGLTALCGDLFSPSALGPLQTAEMDNGTLLSALARLSIFRQPGTGQRVRVNYGALATEEFGSVYERLLELHPVIHPGAAPKFAFKSAAGNERKTTGSYYTPSSLVECLLDSALDPVLGERLAREKGAGAEEAILSLKVCDPACGSGHFLIAAAQRIARRLAALRAGDEEPSPDQLRHALRQIISRCLYGVDINPMSVELCKVTLWLEATEPGKPLSFLDHHIQCGNSLLGATPRVLADGLPDETFKPLTGDDRDACTELKRLNKRERSGFGDLFMREEREIEQRLRQAVLELDSLPDDAIQAKERMFRDWRASYDYLHKKRLADTWCAAFVIRKSLSEPNNTASPLGITQRHLRELAADSSLPEQLGTEVTDLARRYRFFHWHLAFPDVFRAPTNGECPGSQNAGWDGGFDIILGNPPWEHVELKEREWFAERRPNIANATNDAARKKLIATLKSEDPSLYAEFVAALREAEGESHFMRSSGLYPLCGRGRINLYAVFAESIRSRLKAVGRMGIVLPSGIASDDTTKFFFQDLMDERALVSLFDFENKGIFAGVHSSYKFCLFTSGGMRGPLVHDSVFVFFAHGVDDLRDQHRRFTLSAEDIALLNPNTRTCPIFRCRRDAELTKSIYARVPILVREGPPEESPWGIRFRQGLFNIATDSQLFRTRPQLEAEDWRLDGNVFRLDNEDYLPLYEAKMTNLFDHRHGSILGADDVAELSGIPAQATTLTQHQDPNHLAMPRYWVPKREVEEELRRTGWKRRFFISTRDVARGTDVRTAIQAAIPALAVGHKAPLILPMQAADGESAVLLANLNAFVLDFIVRQKIGGASLSFFIIKQLAVLPPSAYLQPCPWAGEAATLIRDWLSLRVLELSYTAWDLEPFARDCGWFGPPFVWDEARRFQLRCELDAAFFHLYGLRREDTAYILDSFPIVRRKDEERTERREGKPRYVTKETILARHDELATCAATGSVFTGELEIPSADPRVAHPPRLPTVPRVSLPGREYFEVVLPLLLSMVPGGIERARLFHAITLLTDVSRRRVEATKELGDVGRQWAEAFREHYDWQEAGEALLSEMRKHRIRGVNQLRLAGNAAVIASNPWLCLDAFVALRLALVAGPGIARQSETAQQPWTDKIIQLQQAA